jgi:FkbH-like protein
LNFLEAHRAVREFRGGERLPLLLALSGTGEPFELYLRAAGARAGRAVEARFLPFNTLAQHLLEPPSEGARVLLLAPWDLVPEADWRSGLPAAAPDESELRERALATLERVVRSRPTGLLYLPAPLPPLWPDAHRCAALADWLQSLARGLGARILPAEAFSLGSYAASGCPVSGSALGATALAAVEAALGRGRESAKVLVSDLDEVMWAGVVGEDGAEGIACAPDARGLRHFVYQTLLRRLRSEGVLIAAVSRNDPEIALAPLRTGRTLLAEEDLVVVLASYQAKSAQIQALAAQLDLGLDAFVYVDDNPVELAEVALQLPEVRREAFPSRDEELPAFLERLNAHFERRVVTAEDRDRTALYRRRLAGLAPSHMSGADLTGFLRGLGMTLRIHDRSHGSRERAVQLINKTNQFNINGRRLTDEAVAAALAAGGRLYTASLEDRTGSHGEVLGLLMTGEGTVTSFVMSCRVLQRRAEHAFLAWVAGRTPAPRRFEVAATPRNEPARQFLGDAAFEPAGDGLLGFDAAGFRSAHADDLALFQLDEPGPP